MKMEMEQVNKEVNLNLQEVIDANAELVMKLVGKIGVNKMASELSKRCEPFNFNNILNNIKNNK